MAPLPSSPAGSRFQGGPRKPSENRGPHRCIRLVSRPSPVVSVSTSVCTFLQRVLTSETVTRWVEMEKSVRMVSERSLRDRRGHDHVGTDTPTLGLQRGCRRPEGKGKAWPGGAMGDGAPQGATPRPWKRSQGVAIAQVSVCHGGAGLTPPMRHPRLTPFSVSQ